jgi:hypothetical protein
VGVKLQLKYIPSLLSSPKERRKEARSDIKKRILIKNKTIAASPPLEKKGRVLKIINKEQRINWLYYKNLKTYLSLNIK